VRKHVAFIALLVVTLSSSVLIGCGETTTDNKTPSDYEVVSSYDWSQLPEKQKPEYYGYTEEPMTNMQTIGVVSSTELENPAKPITRGQFISWLVKGLQLETDTGYSFGDVPEDHPYFEAISTAAQNDIIEQNDTFMPDDELLRGDAAVWLINAKGEEAKEHAASIVEPLIPAQDGWDKVLEMGDEIANALSVCILPDYQLMYYRWLAGDDFRYIRPEYPMLVSEACFSIYMLLNPPVRGGNLTIGQSQEPTTLFSGLDQMSAMTQITALLYESSTGGFDEFWGRFPVMIKTMPTRENGDWEIFYNENGEIDKMIVTYRLHKGLKWSDGAEITAKDALFSFFFYNHPAAPVIHSEMDFWIDDMVALDDYTVQVTWNTPYLYANSGIGVLPAHWFEEQYDYVLEPYNINDKSYYDYDMDDPNSQENEAYVSQKCKDDANFIVSATQGDAKNAYGRNPLHAGPYKVKSWERGQTIILEPNENYMYGKPLIDNIVFRTIETTDTLLAAAIAGQVNMTLTGLTFDQAKQLEKQATDQIPIFTPSLTWEHIDLNCDNEYLSDARVRQALLCGIDRQLISDQFFEGQQPVAHAWLPPKHPAFDDQTITKWDYDVEKAIQLFSEAGWNIKGEGKNAKMVNAAGKQFTITFMTTSGNKQREQVQAVIKSGWEENLKINVDLKNEQSTSFFTATLRERKFSGPSGAMYAWVMGPTSNLYSIVNSEQIPTEQNGWSGQNYTAYSNEEVDRLTSNILKMLDKQEIYNNLRIVQEHLSRDIPSLPLFYRVDISSRHKNIANFQPTGTSSPITWNASWWYWKK
jgi:peptide/nickel transport system substrate-binding protein